MTIFHVQREDREYFFKELPEWAESSDYTVTELVPKDEHSQDEHIRLLEELYTLEDKQLTGVKDRLEEAVELIESISEFAAKKTDNLAECQGLLHLIAKSCDKWLEPESDETSE
jgi:hypothetical protein